MQNWDDEENIKSITAGDIANCVQSSEDMVSVSAGDLRDLGKVTPASIADASRSNRSAADAKSQLNESMGEEEIAEALKSNESSLGAASLLRRKEIEMKQ